MKSEFYVKCIEKDGVHMLLKPNDKIVLKRDLKNGEKYSDVHWYDTMLSNGHCVVKSVNGNLFTIFGENKK